MHMDVDDAISRVRSAPLGGTECGRHDDGDGGPTIVGGTILALTREAGDTNAWTASGERVAAAAAAAAMTVGKFFIVYDGKARPTR
jgi:hypothetical protein